MKSIDVASWYRSLNLVAPLPTAADQVTWTDVVNQAGPPDFDSAAVKRTLLTRLQGT